MSEAWRRDENRVAVQVYHERSKHRPTRYAAGPGYMDWDSQPDPFRTYIGAAPIQLPLAADGVGAAYENLFGSEPLSARPLESRWVGALLELSLGLSAWKSHQGGSWALRCNPSSGNLHPTEGYLVIPDLAGGEEAGAPELTAGVHHYHSREHVLEQRRASPELIRKLPAGSFLVGLSSIHWRESWKYGERAYRYCQLDVGHAVAAFSYAAAALGWRIQILAQPGDDAVAGLLGLNERGGERLAEPEEPDLLMQVWTEESPAEPLSGADVEALAAAAQGEWRGRANVLSPSHPHHWPAIDDCAAAGRKPPSEETAPWRPAALPPLAPGPSALAAADLIRQRRSAQAYDGETALSREAFLRILDRLLPREGVPPWPALPWAPRIHPVFMVHRVAGVTPGAYILVRRPGAEEMLREALKEDFHWEKPEGTPDHLPLFRLGSGDLRAHAEALSCQQEIAADGVFSAGMLAEFDATLRNVGPWAYRQLFWEAGVLGQVLYLEAEAEGIRGTGIGCFLDDQFHDILGIAGTDLQSLYHFTVGGAREDARLETLPPYGFHQG